MTTTILASYCAHYCLLRPSSHLRSAGLGLLQPLTAGPSRHRRLFSLLIALKSHGTTGPSPCNIVQQAHWRRPTPSAPSSLRPAYALHGRAFWGGRRRIIKHYADLPPVYLDEDGLEYRKEGGTLDAAAAARIFHGLPPMDAQRADRLLRILHGRRVAGTLDDPSWHLRRNTAAYPARAVQCALEHLRATVPVDEVANAGLRAEDELCALAAAAPEADDNGPADPTLPWSLYKHPHPRPPAPHTSVYGEGVIDRMRARNLARREAADDQSDEKAAAPTGDDRHCPAPGLVITQHPAPPAAISPTEARYRMEATSALEAPPNTARWRLLLPTTLFVAALLPLLWWAAAGAPWRRTTTTTTTTTEAEQQQQQQAALWGIIAVNVAVFIAWRRMGLWRVLNRWAIMDMVTPRAVGAVTAVFSHQELEHLLTNMAVLWVLGRPLAGELGPGEFLAVYVGCGAAGFAASLYWCVLTRRLTYSLGASSAVFGVACAYFWLYRFHAFKLLGLPPDPLAGIQGLALIALIVALNLLPALRARPGRADWVSHLAGIAAGIAFGALLESQRTNTTTNTNTAAAAAARRLPGSSTTPLLVDERTRSKDK